MGIKRVVDSGFWADPKVIDNYSPEDKYFMLYLLTNIHTTQLGIYKLPKKIIAFEIGYSLESVVVLLDRFETKYKAIKYNHHTQEVAIMNYLKYSILKGGRPVSDLLAKELQKVDDEGFIRSVYANMTAFWETSARKYDRTIKELFDSELSRRMLIKDIKNDNENDNDNDNDNDNEESSYESPNESYNDSKKDDSISVSNKTSKQGKMLPDIYDDHQKSINQFYEQNGFGSISPTIIDNFIAWREDLKAVGATEDDAALLIIYAMRRALEYNVRSYSYVNSILKSYEQHRYLNVDQVKAEEKKGRSKHKTPPDNELPDSGVTAF
ncbi:DnaD domain protein [Enterococcus hirae]|nr:DnaD domain protein [Enterococcus hirae]